MTCRRCGAPAAIVEIACEQRVISGALCDACRTNALDELALLRTEFEGLVAAGLSREEANRMMIRKIDGKGARA